MKVWEAEFGIEIEIEIEIIKIEDGMILWGSGSGDRWGSGKSFPGRFKIATVSRLCLALRFENGSQGEEEEEEEERRSKSIT